MLLVPTYIAPSAIQGLGLFLAEPIAAGVRVWTFDTRIDRTFTSADLEALPALARQHIEAHAVYNAARDRWMMPGDDARFINHANRANTRSLETAFGDDIAVRDLARGEEITCDYRAICDACSRDPSQFGFLRNP